jgi:hypothetical protein
LAGACFAADDDVDFVADDFLAVDFFAGDDFFAVDFFAALVDVDFLAGALFVVAEVDDFFAADFVVVDFFAGDFFAVVEAVDFLAGDFLAVDVDALDFFAGDFFAVVDEVDFVAGAAERLPVAAPVTFAAADFAALVAAAGVAFSTVAMVSFGSFLVPATTSLSWAPGLKLGTAFFFDFILAPVEGLRTQRASRTRLSKEPKPVIATFSPLATSRVMVSSTESSAWAAAFRLPSNRAARVSIS